MTDLDALAKTIYGEARGEGLQGMIAVANVIMNRVKIAFEWRSRGKTHPLFGSGTVETACLAPWQFSCWNKHDPNLPKLQVLTPKTDEQAQQAWGIARDAIDHCLKDNTAGATHYYSRFISPPNWSHGKNPCSKIKNQIFFRDIS